MLLRSNDFEGFAVQLELYKSLTTVLQKGQKHAISAPGRNTGTSPPMIMNGYLALHYLMRYIDEDASRLRDVMCFPRATPYLTYLR